MRKTVWLNKVMVQKLAVVVYDQLIGTEETHSVFIKLLCIRFGAK